MNLGFTQIGCVHKFPSNLRRKFNYSVFVLLIQDRGTMGEWRGGVGGQLRDLLRRLYCRKDELILLP